MQMPSFEQLLVAGCHWADGVASGRSAATLYKVLEERVIELTTIRYVRNSRPNVVIHRVRSIDPKDITRIGVIPVTTPVRTLIDLAAVVDPSALRDTVDQARRRDLVSWRRLDQALREPARGRKGIAELRLILMEGLDSELERMFKRLCANSSLPTPVTQFEVHIPGGRSVFIDFAFPTERVAIETDGYEPHSDRVAFQHDRMKWRELTNLGWTVLCFTYDDIKYRPQQVVATIMTALRNAVSKGA